MNLERALMNNTRFMVLLLAASGFASQAFAVLAPADAPAGTTAICKDGSYGFSQLKSDACKTHGGVKTWYEVPDARAKNAPSDARRAPTSPNPAAAAKSIADDANAPPNKSNAP